MAEWKNNEENKELSNVLSEIHLAATGVKSLESYAETLEKEALAPMKEYLQTLTTATTDSEEYVQAEKTVKAKISNLENSVHVTTDLERVTSKVGALEYIKAELTPAIERLQAEYDAKYVIVDATEDAEMALAIRKTLKEKMYDALVKPITSLFKRKTKIKN